MKVSIITCTYNSESFLEETIKSVLTQNYPQIEYIIIDGGSTDNTLNIARRYEDRIRFVSERDKGIADAMNKGIKLATGDIMAHLHSDDYYLHASVIRNVVRIFMETGCHWLFGRIKNIIKGKLYDLKYKVPQYSYEQLLKRNFIPHQATFIRREAFENVGFFDISLKYAMDYDMWLRIGKLYDPFQTNEYFTVFRRHQKSLSTREIRRAYWEDYIVRRRYIKNSIKSESEHLFRFIYRFTKIFLRSHL